MLSITARVPTGSVPFFIELTPDLRPGLTNAAPSGLRRGRYKFHPNIDCHSEQSEEPMQALNVITADGKCTDPSARKKRGPQDDRARTQAGLRPADSRGRLSPHEPKSVPRGHAAVLLQPL